MATTFEIPLIVEDENRNRYINREKVGESFFVLNADDYPLVVPPGQSQTTTFQIPEDAGHSGDFEVAGLIGRALAPFALEMDEVGVDASGFMNTSMHHGLCVGAGGLPFVLKETVLFLAGRTVRLIVTNKSTTIPNSVRLSAIGRRFTSEMKPEDRACKRDFLSSRPTRAFWLGLDDGPVTLLGGVQGQEFTMTMPSGSHFLLDEILFEAQNDAIGMKLLDAQSGKEITFGWGTAGGFVDLRTAGGTGRLPAQCLGSPVVQPRRSIRAVFNENSGASNVLNFASHGRRIRLPMSP